MYHQITKRLTNLIDRLSLSNNISKFEFEKIVRSKVIVKIQSALKDMPITVPVETIVDNFGRLGRLVFFIKM